jgi:hypothetical protein
MNLGKGMTFPRKFFYRAITVGPGVYPAGNTRIQKSKGRVLCEDPAFFPAHKDVADAKVFR